MKIIQIIFLVIASIKCTSAALTEADLNQIYEDCLIDDDIIDYNCNEYCQQLIDDFIQDVKDINSKKAVRPCDEWWTYQESNDYDANNIDAEKVFKYEQCMNQLSHLVQYDYEQHLIFSCNSFEIDNYLFDNGFYFEVEDEKDLIFQLDDITQCESQCQLITDCDEDCLAFIEDNFDNKKQSCEDAEYDKDNLTESERSYDYAENYRNCLLDNLIYVNSFKSIRQQIDLQALYNTVTFENNYNIDYSTLSNLDAGQKAYLTLDCQTQCYDYFPLYGLDKNVLEYYDNKHVLLELYEEYKFKEFYYDYCFEIYPYQIYLNKNEYKYHDLDCLVCFDDNGHLEAGSEAEENNCDSEYCYVEFFNCIDTCDSENCYYDTCFDKPKGQSFKEYIKKVCYSFYKLEQQYIYDGNIVNIEQTSTEYLESYSDCISKLKIYEENNDERTESDKEQILEYYTCLAQCTEEKTAIENKSGFQSKLVLTLGSLILSLLLLV